MNQQSLLNPSLFEYINSKISSVLKGGDILIVIPPFYDIHSLALGSYVLQAVAKKHNYQVDILHLDLILTDLIGIDDYMAIHKSPEFWMLGERMFARSAYGLPPLGEGVEDIDNPFVNIAHTKNANFFVSEPEEFHLEKHLLIEKVCYELIVYAAKVITASAYKVVGVSLGFGNQINATIALVNEIKALNSTCTTIVGGSYCEGEKAQGLFTLSDHIDHIFEGESEDIFVEFLHNVFKGKPNPERLIKAKKAVALENTPIVDYEAYATQVKQIMGAAFYEKNIIAVWYETNRGCWWAEKAQCTFCGITEIGFRQKSTQKIIADLQAIKQQVPGKAVFFTDVIMSSTFPDKVLKTGVDVKTFPPIGLQIKVGRTIEDVDKLKKINVHFVLPGVESFSTKLLKKIKKGTTGKQNLYFLRNTYCFDIYTQYNLLWGLPNDLLADYEQLLYIIPFIKHLQPPRFFVGMRIGRDAPYFFEAEKHQVTDLHYWNVYDKIFPANVDIKQVANYFIGHFQNDSFHNIEIIEKVSEMIFDWKKVWKRTQLQLTPLLGKYIITDSRYINQPKTVAHIVSEEEAQEFMSYQRYARNPVLEWALENNLGVIVDDWYVPLVTTRPELLIKLDVKQKAKEKKFGNIV